MAITIVSSPGNVLSGASFNSMHEPIWHVVTSSNVAQPDFRFIFDINIGGVDVARLKVVPDPSNSNQGIIDVARVVRSYITNYFNPNLVSGSPFTMNTDAITVEYTVYYGEEYLGTFAPSLVARTCYAYNNYTADTAAQTLVSKQYGWMTSRRVDVTGNQQDGIWMPRNANGFISFLNDTEENLQIRVQEIDIDGAPINIFLYYDTSVITSLQKLLVINMNLDYINNAPYTGGPDPLPTTAAGYRLWIIREDGVTLSEAYSVRWLCEPKIEATTIHFLNRFGGFDSYHFTGPTRKAVGLERKTFERLKPYNANSSYETKIQYNTKHDWTRRLSSGYVDDVTHEWLWQLVASPQVFIELDGVNYPVIIKTQQWTEKKNRFDKLYNLELEIEMGKSVTSQNR